MHQSRTLDRFEINRSGGQTVESVKADLSGKLFELRTKSDFRKSALQGHLAAFEADLMVAAGTRTLPLVAASAGLAQAGASATADAGARFPALRGRMQIIKLHDPASSTRRR